jgi:SpoVK/Ycf46/Vps4 family AAA+-type ATPase
MNSTIPTTHLNLPALEGENPSKLTPIPSLVRSRSIVKLWAMRMMVRLGAGTRFAGLPHLFMDASIRGELRTSDLQANELDSSQAARQQWAQRLELTLQTMEARANRYTWSRTVEDNLRLLDEAFFLTKAEKAIFVLAATLRANDDLVDIAEHCKSQVDVTDQLRRILKLPIDQIRRAVSPQGALRRAGIVSVSSGDNPSKNLELQRGRLRCLVTTRLKSANELFSGILAEGGATKLSARDYAHLSPDVGFLSSMLAEALDSRRRGVNVLLHGKPGTGKTELTRLLAQQAAAPLYVVSCMNEEGNPLDARRRLSGASTAQYMLKGRRALLAFDEVDAIFTDGSALFGKPTTAEQSKAWVNELLEQNSVPTLWVANAIESMDPAFVRRFDVVIEMKLPPLPQRISLLSRQCGAILTSDQIRRLAQVDTVTPALVTRAAGVVQRTAMPATQRAWILEALIDGTLRAQGHKPIRQDARVTPGHNYDPDLCNASMNLRALAAGVVAAGTGRICLYGPPGTGKTAFGYWLSEQLGRPLMLKRVSDIQSPMLGVMERNLARAFEQASRDGAVLQIDEVDGFLRDRREARQGWEVSQVNEFLTQLESYDGLFIASTNLMAGLDPAALRRFDYKVSIGYLLPHQRIAMLASLLRAADLAAEITESTLERLNELQTLTPGDFDLVRRQHRIKPLTSQDEIIHVLAGEAADKEPIQSRRMGFI